MSQSRRRFLGVSAATASIHLAGSIDTVLGFPRAERDAMTPLEVMTLMKKGNERFRSGVRVNRDFLREQRDRASGQFPGAVVLSCIDSRAPAEILMDLGIGDVFNTRTAGHVVNAEVLGGLEFACHVAGAKLVLVLGHTSCGAVAGAIDGVKLGNLTSLLARIEPAVAATSFGGHRASSNTAFVDAVARTNVEMTMQSIRSDSPVLRELEAKGAIAIAGAMYDLSSATIRFLPPHETVS